jgi:TolB-like protein
VLLAIIAVTGLALWPAEPIALPQPPSFRVAVLPFAHYAAGGADETVAARITDGVTTELARLNQVGVVSRTSASQFRDARKPLREIAQQLSAAAVIEGTVTADGDLLRVTTRIVDSRTDLKMAVRDFEGSRDRLDELSRRIAAALSASFHSHREW